VNLNADFSGSRSTNPLFDSQRAAAVVAFGFAKIFGEPQVDRAIAFENQMDRAKGESAGPDIVSRPTQAGLGGARGSLRLSCRALGEILASMASAPSVDRRHVFSILTWCSRIWRNSKKRLAFLERPQCLAPLLTS
jgi:hypothetical protein